MRFGFNGDKLCQACLKRPASPKIRATPALCMSRGHPWDRWRSQGQTCTDINECPASEVASARKTLAGRRVGDDAIIVCKRRCPPSVMKAGMRQRDWRVLVTSRASPLWWAEMNIALKTVSAEFLIGEAERVGSKSGRITGPRSHFRSRSRYLPKAIRGSDRRCGGLSLPRQRIRQAGFCHNNSSANSTWLITS